MTNPKTRRLVAEFAIGLMVCGAAYYFLVEPANRALAQTRAKLNAVDSRGRSANPAQALTDEQVKILLHTTATRSAEIAKRSDLARDESRMFAAIMALAADHNVRVDQLQPVAVKADPVITKPDAPTPADPAAPKDTRVVYSLTVQATYSDLARFLHGLTASTGYTVIRSVRIDPSETSTPAGSVIARIETETHAFDVANALSPNPGARPVAGAPGGD